MFKWIKDCFYELALLLSQPTKGELVRKLIANTAGLELLKGEDKRLPPIDGTFGPFIFTGNTNPQIRYTTFDDTLMEFVAVTVSLNLPDRITFESETEDLGKINTKPQYERYFYRLAYSLYRYFPLAPDRTRNLTNHVIV